NSVPSVALRIRMVGIGKLLLIPSCDLLLAVDLGDSHSRAIRIDGAHWMACWGLGKHTQQVFNRGIQLWIGPRGQSGRIGGHLDVGIHAVALDAPCTIRLVE